MEGLYGTFLKKRYGDMAPLEFALNERVQPSYVSGLLSVGKEYAGDILSIDYVKCPPLEELPMLRERVEALQASLQHYLRHSQIWSWNGLITCMPEAVGVAVFSQMPYYLIVTGRDPLPKMALIKSGGAG